MIQGRSADRLMQAGVPTLRQYVLQPEPGPLDSSAKASGLGLGLPWDPLAGSLDQEGSATVLSGHGATPHS